MKIFRNEKTNQYTLAETNDGRVRIVDTTAEKAEAWARSLAEKFKGRAKVAAINIDNHQNLAIKLGIQSIPTLIIFNKSIKLQFSILKDSVCRCQIIKP